MTTRWHCPKGRPLCTRCRARRALYERRRSKARALGYPSGMRPAIGYTRRLQALGWLGYTLTGMARDCSTTRNVLRRIQSGKSEHVAWHLGERIEAMYKACSMRPAPVNRYTTAARAEARRHGWASPLMWDDIDAEDATPQGVRSAS